MVRYFYDALLINEEDISKMCELLQEMICKEVFFFLKVEENEIKNDVSLKEKIKKAKELIKSSANEKIKWCIGVFIENAKNIKIIRSMRKKFGDSLIIAVEANNFECLRKMVDSKAANIIVDPQKQRKDEGIDHVIAKKMKESNTGLMISLSNLFSIEGKKRCMEFGKIKEICKYYNKYSFPLIFASFTFEARLIRDPLSRASLARELGVKEDKALDTVSENYSKIKINENKNFVVRRIK